MNFIKFVFIFLIFLDNDHAFLLQFYPENIFLDEATDNDDNTQVEIA